MGSSGDPSSTGFTRSEDPGYLRSLSSAVNFPGRALSREGPCVDGAHHIRRQERRTFEDLEPIDHAMCPYLPGASLRLLTGSPVQHRSGEKSHTVAHLNVNGVPTDVGIPRELAPNIPSQLRIDERLKGGLHLNLIVRALVDIDQQGVGAGAQTRGAGGLPNAAGCR